MKLKEKSHMPISVALLAMSIGILGYMYLMQFRVFWNSTVEQLTINTLKQEREINAWFARKIMIVDMMSENLHHFNVTETEKLGDFFTKIVATSPSVIAAYIGMEDKSVVLNDKMEIPLGYDPTVRIWYVQANKNFGKTIVSEPYIDKLTGELIITICKKIQLNNGVNGVIGININTNDITDLLSSMHANSSGTFFLLTSNESIIMHPNEKLLPSKVDDTSDRVKFSKYSDIKTSNIEHIQTTNSNVSIKLLTMDNVKKYIARIKIENVGWIYGYEIPVSFFYGDRVRATIPFLIIIIIGFLTLLSNIIFNWWHIKEIKLSRKNAEALSKTAAIFLSHGEASFEDTMNDGVKPGSDLIGFDRVSVFRNSICEDGLRALQIYRWTKTADIMQMDVKLADIRYDDIAKEWKRIFTSGKSINSPVKQLSGSEAALLKASGAVSVFATPIFINETFWGFVLYEDHKNERYFREDFADVMHHGALLCVNTILRAEMERKIKKIAHTDSLTGILNRLRFMDLTSKQIERIKRTGNDSYIAIFDLDYFKSINDTYGHLIGDRVLKCTAERVNSAIRPYDLFGRYGGEEFILFISDINEADTINHTERIRTAICDTPMVFEEVKLTVSASFGVASVMSADNIKDVINLADKALYKAKHEGRNRVMMA